jgi:hypothetical protein
MKEFMGSSLFNHFAKPHKLIHPLMWLQVTSPFKVVHRPGADRALNHLVLIEHRKLDDHSIEVVALHLASPQWHCEFSHTETNSFYHVDRSMSDSLR